MDNLTVILLVLQGISTLCFFFGVFIVQSFKKSFDDMQRSVNDLNINIATLIQKDTNKDERLVEHKSSIGRLFKEVDLIRVKYHDLVNDMSSRVALLEVHMAEIKNKINR